MKTLIVIDMQNDFVTGSLANPAAEAIIPFIKSECESGKYRDILFTQDTHYDSNYLETQEGKYLPIKHCIYKTEGWEIVDELKGYLKIGTLPQPPLNTMPKEAFGFNGWGMISFRDGEEIVLVGTCTDICVITNALLLKTYYPENKITVLAKGCAGLTPEKHAAALEVMKSCQINVEE